MANGERVVGYAAVVAGSDTPVSYCLFAAARVVIGCSATIQRVRDKIYM